VIRVDHAQVLGSCSSCHNGNTAVGKNPGHFVTALECDSCHNTDSFIPDEFRHTTTPFEPLDHRGNLACTECHQNNSEVVVWQFPAFQPDCAGCHAGDYRPNKHEAANGGDETVSENRNCAGACHQKNSFHRITDAAWAN